MITADVARALLEQAHDGWNRRHLTAMLDQFTDDMEFWVNTGDPAGGPIEFKGKALFRQSLEAMLLTTKSKSKLEAFRFDGEVGHARASITMHSFASGATITAAYRQLARYSGGKIRRLEEYHDAGLLNAFWKLHAAGAAAELAVWDVEPNFDVTD